MDSKIKVILYCLFPILNAGWLIGRADALVLGDPMVRMGGCRFGVGG
ncbi:hypothetical protein SAMN04488513_10215 [Pseudozobellia thermophila]|uniref:Uncharacterized protein n=1 Tax=Pseudozobellia thermophila TaxID=192903 RepID=A0A1M6ECL4_9FLAO|nr:hypothetical protein SAMN04488513_10215 [Pseudozobellia thermophila]